MPLTKETTLGEIVKQNFRTAEVLESYELDFCCGGKKSLQAACAERNLNAEKVLDELYKATESPAEEANHADRWELDFLIDYILNNHHAYLRHALPTIYARAQKVSIKHGENHPETKKIFAVFSNMKLELEQHMMKEEHILFPYIRTLVNAKRENRKIFPPPFGSVQNPVQMMEHEHESAGNAVSEIHALTSSHCPPEDACTTFQLLYSELRRFEHDLHKHIHLENNILFPQAVAMEKELFFQTAYL